ncbi:methyltransferase domain-containing protein [Thiobaca trueperi]|uniref:Methyltransferase family protein n=1 Tax=Thiobaca trueperi TaxID=127458 RepID=A0A4V2V0Z1_9GAMM|nr:methyltransferase domain-containing protein [Thiobaca trueperi]TCT19152.1 methyltransferase family protein [Thiobaca trueperi]
MSQLATVVGASAPDRLSRLIQKRVFGDQVKIPLEIRLWGGRTYRFGDDEPAVKIVVMEHLPDYPAVLRQIQRLLKPGGRLYLDARATRNKYDKPSFIARWGETLYRRFRLYLWGSAQAFLSRRADAFRVVLERPLEA